MTDKDIIKALECCKKGHCAGCPCSVECLGQMPMEALNLINRQKAEIERLNGENKAFGEIIKKQDDEISVLRKELLKREDLEKSFSKAVKQFEKNLQKR